jgi:uncharacterized protein (TIGR02444 family)
LGYDAAPAVPPAIDCSPALWPFAVHVYALPGVSGLCLRLQDEHGLDADLLLAILWRACRGAAVDDAVLDRLVAAAAPLRPRVQELRALRRAVGSDRVQEPRWRETYEHLKAAELAAEHVELSMLEASLTTEPTVLPQSPAGLPQSPAGLQPAVLALAALGRLAERSGARSCEPLLQALVEAVLPRPSATRDLSPPA